MQKIVYTRPEDNGVSIVIPADKTSLEKALGPLTDEAYEVHVWSRSVPKDAINSRYVSEEDIPPTREFRNAWRDATTESRIDICLEKAKQLQLTKLREVRDEELRWYDGLMIRALEEDDKVKIESFKSIRSFLRNATEPLKALEVSGYNDEAVLEQIRTLGELNFTI